jgi:anti-anti-sigma regulatory factor
LRICTVGTINTGGTEGRTEGFYSAEGRKHNMGSKFSSELTSRDGVTTLKVAGVIDEDNELVNLESKLSGGATVLDLSDIERINSCGVRDWVNWLGRVEKNGARLVFVNCSPAIVSQLNLVHNFTAKGIVKSFYAPYFCPRCKKEKLLRLEARDLAKQTPVTKAPTCRCDECDGVMDFDEMEESYFAFLNKTEKIYGGPEFESTLREIAAAGEAGARTRARSTGANLPPVNPSQTGGGGTPTGPAPSSTSPLNRTPTPRTPTGNTGGSLPTGGPKASPTGAKVSPQNAGTSPKTSPTGKTGSGTGPQNALSASQTKLAPVRSDGNGHGASSMPSAAGLSPINVGQSSSALRPPPRPILPWIFLSAFLLAAGALLAFALLR